MWDEFRQFIARGSVIDLAVGIVIGAAFGTVVKSFVDDILMPPIGLATGGVDFSNLFIPLKGGHFESLAAAKAAGAPVIAYGSFINDVISFLIIAFAVFLVVKGYNRLRTMYETEPPAAPTEKNCPFCYSKIPLPATRCPSCTSELTAVAG